MDNEYLDIIGLGIFKALNDKRYPILVNGKISESAIPTSITNSITSILSLIPDAASSENKLADKNFVNSSIATNTATFRGTFDDLATLQATSADINDYAFYVHTDEIGNTAYDRYKHNGSTWVFEYTLNNSSFTAEQWSAINSGITTTKVGNYDAHLINYSNPHKVTKSQVGLENVENVALSSWAGSNKITTLGTITAGVWNGSKIGNDYLANSSITIGTTAISLGSTAKSLAGIEKLQLNDANSNLIYDSTTGSWKLTGNLLVTGFISAGAKGNSSSGGGSTYTQREWAEIKIMSASEIGLLASAYSVKEAYNELNTAIETLAGKATNVKFSQTLTSGKQIGSISIDGKSTSLFAPANYAWSEVTGKPTFATVATSGSYTDLSNKPTIASLMGSTAIGGTSSYLYWNGSAWATKALGTAAFSSSSDFAAASHTHSNYVDLTSQQTITGNKFFSGAIQVGAIGINTDNVGLYGYGEDAVEIHAENTLTLCGERNTYIGNADNSAMVDIQEDMAGYNAETGVETWYIYREGYAEFQSILGALANSLAIKLNGGTTEGTNLFTFNNSASKTINITPSAIGAAAASHTHSYLPLAGGTMSNTNVVTNLNADLLDGYHASSLSKIAAISLTLGQVLRIDMSLHTRGLLINAQSINMGRNALYFVAGYGNGTTIRNDIRVIKGGPYDLYFNGTSEKGCVYIVGTSTTGYSIDEIYINPFDYNDITYTIVSSVPSDAVLVSSSNSNILATLDSNVASSSKWSTARTITLTGSVTGSVSIDGSANVSLATTTNHTHSYLPLTGGTVTGPLIINTVLDRSFILDEPEGEKYHIISFRASGEEYAYLLAGISGSESKLVFNGSTILHSGNVGNYALKTDGSNVMTGGISWNNASVGTNVDTFGEGLIVGRTTDSGTTLDGLGYKYASVLNVSNGVYRFQIASAATNVNKLLYRGYDANAKTYFDWKTIAFTDSNVASSSKWANARTITLTGSVTGSVSIDGSQNVSLATTTNHTHTFASLTDKPTTISGYGITDALTSKYITYKQDYQRYVILLCRIGSNTTNNAHTINGTFWTSEAGGSRYQAAYINVHCSDWATGHNEYYGFTPFGTGTKSRLVTCTHQSVQYLAITFESVQATYIYFDGSYSNILFTPILYMSKGGTVENSEIYNSITEVTYNKIPLISSAETALTSSNYNSYAPKLDGTGASGTWGISISGNAATATDADKLDGVHYQNILERQNSGYSTSGTATGWFRIAETLTNNGAGITFLLAIQRNYWYVNNESYLFAISINYNGGISVTQLSGYANNRLITKIRVEWDNSRIAYIDLYINSSSTDNGYYWYTVGCAKSYTAWTANPTLIGTAYEFTTVQGCKSDRGFTGDLTGNASSATKLATSRTIWGQSFDGTGNVSGALTGVTNITASGHAKVDSLKAMSICIECDNSGNTAGRGSEINNYDGHLYLQHDTSHHCFICTGGGNVGIGTSGPSYKLHVAGVAYASEGLVSDGYISAASTSTSSDIRLKDNISEISSEMALKWLSMLKPKSWSWNSLAGVKGQSMGFVAQDVEGILPQMIRKRRDNDYLTLDYTQLHALEVSALQSHEKRIEELERENKILKEELNKLKLYAN